MMNIEQRVQTLELISIMQKIDIEVVKGKDASKRWGTPEGNPVAVLHLKRAEEAIQLFPWPAELRENAGTVLECLAKYRRTLEEYDITYGSMYKTHLENAFMTLEKIVYQRLYSQ
jgi:hypothetical protein